MIQVIPKPIVVQAIYFADTTNETMKEVCEFVGCAVTLCNPLTVVRDFEQPRASRPYIEIPDVETRCRVGDYLIKKQSCTVPNYFYFEVYTSDEFKERFTLPTTAPAWVTTFDPPGMQSPTSKDFWDKVLADITAAYNEACQEAGLTDEKDRLRNIQHILKDYIKPQ